MSSLVTAIGTGITTFSITNIDDMVILTLFFSQVNATLRCRHIVIGQYLGFTALVVASIPGFFGGLIVPEPWIGLFGLVPIAIGIKSLLHQEDASEQEDGVTEQSNKNLFFAKFLNLQTYSVAAITIANGTDNISIYVPLFASSSWDILLVILGVFFLLVGVLCYAAYKLTHQKEVADLFIRYGNNLIPFVLIGLGAFIIWDSNIGAGITTVTNKLSAQLFRT